MNRHATGNWDAYHGEVMEDLEKLGCSVVDTSKVGQGFTDLVVGVSDETVLLELKVLDDKGNKPKLRPSQKRFRDAWRGGPILTAYSRAEAVDLILARMNRPRAPERVAAGGRRAS